MALKSASPSKLLSTPSPKRRQPGPPGLLAGVEQQAPLSTRFFLDPDVDRFELAELMDALHVVVYRLVREWHARSRLETPGDVAGTGASQAVDLHLVDGQRSPSVTW